jgi:hypothetical protein
VNDPGACPTCGASIPTDAPGGLCPRCLLQGAVQDDAAERAERDAIQLEFPQLELLARIGQGGMGVVYRARQPELDRLVALKILRGGPTMEPAFLERFRREAQTMARLNHPNIVTIYEYGERGGRPYLVMEHVDGPDLRRVMGERRLAPREAMNVALALCDALEAAHEQGIVHRDIKPANILIDASGRVKVADFGLAKLGEEPAGVSGLTSRGQWVGTPYYMAPEQAAANASASPRADVYAVGVVMHEMLTGELPQGHFAPASRTAGTPVALDAVILKAMSFDPAERYADAGALKRALTRVVVSEPFSSWVPSRHPRRRVAVVLAGMTLAVAGMGVALFLAAQGRRLPMPADVATFGNHSYKLFIDHLSWNEAQRQCARMGGQLAVVESAEENAFLAELSRCHVWLGAARQPRDGAWLWVDGSPLVYANWDEGEPNGAVAGEDSLMMTKYGRWNDLPAGAAIVDGYLCEWPEVGGAATRADPEALQAALREANPAYDGRGAFTMENGVVREAVLSGPGVVDVTALQGLALRKLDLRWSGVTDLTPLQGMPLTALDLTRSQVADLTPLAGMPLTELRLEGTRVHDLSPLVGMPLRYLDIGHSRVTDLAALRGMPLEELHMNRAPVRDLAPLAGMPLRRIGMLDTRVTDLSPLATCPALERADVPPAATNGNGRAHNPETPVRVP